MAISMGRSALAFTLLYLSLSNAAEAAVYRCEGEPLRFVDDPSQCRAAILQPLSRDVQRVTGAPELSQTGAAPGAKPQNLTAALEALLPPAHELEGAWENVAEAPVDPAADPDLVGWGVHAVQTRHYTRKRSGLVETCSVEIWEFGDQSLAGRAHAQIAYPGWQITRHGRMIVMLRGTVFKLGSQFEKGVFEGCDRIGRSVRALANDAVNSAPASVNDGRVD
jgi:hypothetical protein